MFCFLSPFFSRFPPDKIARERQSGKGKETAGSRSQVTISVRGGFLRNRAQSRRMTRSIGRPTGDDRRRHREARRDTPPGRRARLPDVNATKITPSTVQSATVAAIRLHLLALALPPSLYAPLKYAREANPSAICRRRPTLEGHVTKAREVIRKSRNLKSVLGNAISIKLRLA